MEQAREIVWRRWGSWKGAVPSPLERRARELLRHGWEMEGETSVPSRMEVAAEGEDVGSVTDDLRGSS